MVNMTHITDQLTLIILKTTIWSGRKKLVPDDLQLQSGDVPPEELVSLGSKRICDPDQLKVFHRLKQTAERLCLKVGTRFLGGFAVPHDQTELLASKLEELSQEFALATSDFVTNYDAALKDWIFRLPSFEEPIRAAIEPVEVVKKKLGFSYQMIRIAPATQPGSLQEEVAALGDGIFAEVEQMARDLKEAFQGKTKLHRRSLGTFTNIRDKLACLSFVDVRIQPIIDAIEDWLRRLPVEAHISGGLFTEGYGLALLLSNGEQMARHGVGQWQVLHQLIPEAEEIPLPEDDAPTVMVPAMIPPPVNHSPAPLPSLFF